MPPRIARSNFQHAAPKTAKNKSRKRNLDAFAIASHSAPEKNRMKASRLGEFLDDRPKPKRRRDDEDGGESEEENEVPAKRKRAAPQDKDEEEGSDSSGNEWTLGGMKEDDSDSELDSDEAFGESDEEKFEGFTFRGSKSGSGKKPAKASASRARVREDDPEDIDLDEPELSNDGEEDDFGDEGVDLATMLDDDDEEILGGKDTTGRDLGEESVSEDEDDSSNMDADSGSSDNEEDEEERIARMRDRIDAFDASTQPSKTSITQSQSAVLTVEDLLADLDPAQKKQFASALKTRKRSERPKTLTAPLPKRQQDKLNREEAGKKAKEQLDRWQHTVIRNRRAEFLSFPLNDPTTGERMGKDKFVMGEEQAPANELEQNIRKIMEESGLATKPGQKAEDEEDMLLKAEKLATNKMPVEEVMQRRADLRRARELLFREEIKAKRIKKIKSKAYRRVHRKERQRLEKEEEQLRELNGEAGLDEDEQERYERKRAEARMSTKHKDSKFAKAMNQTNRAVWHDGAREAVIDEARRREELKRRIHGEDISDDEAENSDVPSDNDHVSEGDEDGATLNTLHRLSRNQSDGDGESKGLNAMKFMRAADARQRAQNEEDVEAIRKEMAIEDGFEEASDDEIDDEGLGRAIFGPRSQDERSERKGSAPNKKSDLDEGYTSEDGSDNEEQEVAIVTEKPTPGAKRSQKKPITAGNPLAKGFHTTESEKGHGSWLTSAPPQKDKRRKQLLERNVMMDLSARKDKPDESPPDKIVHKLSSKDNSAPKPDSQAPNSDGWTVVQHKDQTNDTPDDEEEPSDPILTAAQRNEAFRGRLFAVDDAIQATFDAEKADAADSEDEKEISSHLPGWGSWTGHGLSKTDKKANAHKKHNPLHKTKVAGVKKEDRKDARLPNVIISEKQNRKGKQYLAPILPHGFETKTQYERSLRLPMGPEWSTKEVFQRATRPRVVVKPGTVVEAMERPLV